MGPFKNGATVASPVWRELIPRYGTRAWENGGGGGVVNALISRLPVGIPQSVTSEGKNYLLFNKVVV